MRTFLPLLMVIGMIAELSAADAKELFEARTFKSGSGELKYRLLKPKDYDANKKYPLVIFFHGAGERGDNNTAQLVHGMNNFASDEIREKYPAFVVAPQCPNNQKWADVDWGADQHTLTKEPSKSMKLSLELLDALQKEFSIDSSRLYVTGLSMGGYGTWDVIHRHPDLFAAAAPICGGGDPAGAKAMAKIPIWVFHGDKDTAVKVKRSREMVEALKAAGADVKYTEYAGVGHDSWTATYKDPKFYEWLFAQKKK